MDLKALFDAVSQRALEAHARRIHRDDCEPGHVYYLDEEGEGMLVRKEAMPEPRAHCASDLSALVAFAVESSSSEIWYSRRAVTVFLDRATRRDRVMLPLAFSGPFSKLLALETKTELFSHKDFVRLLRITLGGGSGDGFIAAVRAVRFKSMTESEGVIQHGRASVGKKVESQLEGAASLVEEVGVRVPIFDGFLSHTAYEVHCAVELDTVNEKFALIPFPGACERAVREAEERIGALLTGMLCNREKGEGEYAVPVFYGTP